MARREEAENASELMTTGTDDGGSTGARIENDALGVHGTATEPRSGGTSAASMTREYPSLYLSSIYNRKGGQCEAEAAPENHVVSTRELSRLSEAARHTQ